MYIYRLKFTPVHPDNATELDNFQQVLMSGKSSISDGDCSKIVQGFSFPQIQYF